MKVGVIGYGTVGHAVANGFEKLGHSVKVNDLEEHERTNHTKEEISAWADVIFITVYQASSVKDVAQQLETDAVVAVKTTVPPGTTRSLECDRVIYNPEFLTEANAEDDFLSPDRIVVGGPQYTEIDELFDAFDAPVFRMEYEAAEYVKYAANALLATKVSYANQIRLLCEQDGVEPAEVMDAVVADARINESHLDPTKGPYGGKCLPKDMEGFIEYADDAALLEAVEEINRKV